MRGKAWSKRLAALGLALVCALAMPFGAAALDDTPEEVLQTKSSVVRIIAMSDTFYGYGTGFAVGEEGSDNVYIVTNYHVVEDCHTFYIFYDTGKRVEASIVKEDQGRDICILKPNKRIPNIEPLRLETENVPDGAAVYALGYPAAADYFSDGGNAQYSSEEDFLRKVIADKSSITITNGIISATRDSILIGDGSREVKILQTNTAINGGNSGGPLLNRAGRLVGINTMGITVADSMNGCVHVDELIAVLKSARISYEGTPEAQDDSSAAGPPQEEGGNTGMIVAIVAVVVLAVGGGVLALVLVARRQKKGKGGGLSLDEFEKQYKRLDDIKALEMVKGFVAGLLPLAGYDLNPLMTIDNIRIDDDSIALRRQGAENVPGQKLSIFPGYSAPENYKDAAGPAATVYFIGAMLYTLTMGQRPPEALSRKETNKPAFAEANALQNLINRAMEPYEQNRIPDIYTLSQELQNVTGAVYAEKGYTGQPSYWQ